MKNKLFTWQETTGGLVFIILFNLLVAYGFVSLAIDSGSLMQWFITVVFLALAAGQAVKLFKKVAHRG